mmetsp:Transcript_3724/g.7911  ORF Transcript_3724/g.7911 Transcript_3724/m.7911 type:complete len:239 (+) Transcript_3724:90-806(+)
MPLRFRGQPRCHQGPTSHRRVPTHTASDATANHTHPDPTTTTTTISTTTRSIILQCRTPPPTPHRLPQPPLHHRRLRPPPRHRRHHPRHTPSDQTLGTSPPSHRSIRSPFQIPFRCLDTIRSTDVATVTVIAIRATTPPIGHAPPLRRKRLSHRRRPRRDHHRYHYHHVLETWWERKRARREWQRRGRSDVHGIVVTRHSNVVERPVDSEGCKGGNLWGSDGKYLAWIRCRGEGWRWR